jgi:phenylpropionate dioxygenase-like ring-hydroxylating dioxygenase large terminal subunit
MLDAKLGSLAGLVDVERGIISREIFVSEEIYRQELERVFARAWLLLGHESQIPRPGDFFVTSTGEESVILCRDAAGRIRAYLNSCRHRGMKVCRYDEGNTVEFLCPYHGWSYGTDGALLGVPFARDAYGQQLDRSRWGLIEVPYLENYKGLIWATWDPDAPAFADYIGGYKLYLDLLLDAWDGREGGTEVIGGVHKWLVPCNWKFPAENFSGDRYHGISHRSVDMVGIGPSGKGRRDNQERNESRWLDVSFPDLGHSM